MATTRLSDTIPIPVVLGYTRQNFIERNRLVNSGAVVMTPQMNQLVAGPSNIFQVPYWGTLGNADSTPIGDDPASSLAARKVVAGDMVGVKCRRVAAWEKANLVTAMVGSDPLGSLASNLAGFKLQDFQKIVTSTAAGVLADNVASDGGDMVYSVATDDAGAITDAERVSAEVLVRAAYTLGDRADELTLLFVHSAQAQQLALNNLITAERDSTGRIIYAEYLGQPVFIDDSLPVTVGANRITYTGMLVGPGAFSAGDAETEDIVPMEFDRAPEKADGGGVETLYIRDNYGVHLIGTKWLGASMAGNTPTNAELANAANWSRVYERKRVPIAFFQTNG